MAASGARTARGRWLGCDQANETQPLSEYTVLDARADVSHGDWRFTAVISNLLDSYAAMFGTFNENRQTDALQRCLTPLEARTTWLTVGRQFGTASAGS